jgi:hypothetical protein
VLDCKMSILTVPVVVYLDNNYDEREMNFYLVIHTNICLVPVKYRKRYREGGEEGYMFHICLLHVPRVVRSVVIPHW